MATRTCNFSTTTFLCKVQPNNLKGKSKTSQDWLTRQLNDPYVKRSRYDNYRARSAYKLLEIDEKYKILKPGHTVVECGAAPGSWTQVIVEKINSDFRNRALAKGTVIAADLIPLDPIPGATILSEADLLKPEAAERILELLDGRPVDAVLSDMAPSASGVKELDHDRIVALAYCSVLLSLRVLSVGGSLLYKIWDGRQAPKLVEDVSRFFEYVNFVKPRASRGDSAEIFVLGRQFKGAERIPAGDTIA